MAVFNIDYLQDFLGKEFSQENLKFWSDCEDYKNLKDVQEVYKKIRNFKLIAFYSFHLKDEISFTTNIPQVFAH